MDYVKLIHENINHDKYVVVNWCMGNTCNFACSYCPTGLHDGTVGWYELENVKNFCANVINHYAPKTVYFEFTGGEVTLWKHFIDLCKFLKEHGAEVGLISNGSRTLRYWGDLKPHIDHVCTSYHPEFSNEEQFLDFIRFLNKDIRVHANIMMSPEKFDECFEVALKVKDIPNISMAMQPLIVDFGTELYEYNEYQQDILERQYHLTGAHIVRNKNFESYRSAMSLIDANGNNIGNWAPHRFISKDLNSWLGWKCSAGTEQIVVNMDGTIYRGWCKVGGCLGHIDDTPLTLPTEQVVCDKEFCHCNFDIMSSKSKD